MSLNAIRENKILANIAKFTVLGPPRENTCLRSVRPCKTQTSMFSNRDKLDN